MSRKVRKGWIRGLARGYENSGEFVATAVPIILVVFFFAAMIGLAVRVNSCMSGEPSCSNYSYKARGTMKCDKWPDMTMKIEEKTLGRDIVHCTCPATAPDDPETNWLRFFWSIMGVN